MSEPVSIVPERVRYPTLRPRALLVDFYGTLAHAPAFNVGLGTHVIADSLGRDGVHIRIEEFDAAYRRAVLPYLETMSRGRETHNTEWVADALSTLGIDAAAGDPRVVRAVRRYFEAYAEAIEPLPGAAEALERLATLAPALPLVMVSNFTDALPVRSSLRRLGWEPRFRAVLISAEIGFRKPHAEIFRRALEAAGCAPGEALHIGDDPVEDVGGAQAAGIPTVLIRAAMLPPLRTLRRDPEGPEPVPDFTIDWFHEILDLIELES